jgi:Plasmid pRiA4b ORF-3-like protein
MTRSRKPAVSAVNPASSAAATDDIVQVKVWLLGISPMVWRRVLVPATFSLRDLHGVLQVAMGWEAIHLYQFSLRAVRYGSWVILTKTGIWLALRVRGFSQKHPA